MGPKASVRDVRRSNRALVVRELILSRDLTRTDLSVRTGLSAGTITSVVTELLADGTIREEGFAESGSGRPRTILNVAPESGYVIGCDISEMEIRTELFDLTLTRIASRQSHFVHRSIEPTAAVDTIAEHVDGLLAESGVEAGAVRGLGLGVPGIAAGRFGSPGFAADTVIDAPAIGWEGVTLDGLAPRLGFPVWVDNGAKTTTQAESWFGAARHSDHAVVVLIGASAGAGIITDGRLYRGRSSSAGEWGHTKLSVDGRRCICGAHGCVDTFVGARAVLERWTDDPAAWRGDESAGIEALFLALENGDRRASLVIEDLVEHLGMALSDLVNLYNPETLVVGGWFGARLTERYLDGIRAATRRHSLKQPGEEVAIERSTQGADVVSRGAATLPIDHFIESGWPRPDRAELARLGSHATGLPDVD